MDFDELDFWFISSLNFQARQAVKIKFELDQKIKFIQVHFSNFIFQTSSTNLQGARRFGDSIKDVCNRLKAPLRTNILNYVTAAPFLVSFLQQAAENKDTENGSAVTSLRAFIPQPQHNLDPNKQPFQRPYQKLPLRESP